ncbi:transposase [Empedobacter tilapiae]|uniref:Transposase n=1 Tax=Empedobacter tilapiae TaxID=2491114 RepID=A0A4Z1B7W9_9FLAO|nr:transposase [Empedobacter tilapiae]TGN30306.1 transposase [Empedobacter tilapiae]
MNFKNIHIGHLIKQRVKECQIENPRICNFLKCTEEEIQEMYQAESLDSKVILLWAKLLEYDFFRIYSQHLILYSPANLDYIKTDEKEDTSLPRFRKNIYTKEIIGFILEQINSKKMTKRQVIERYKIPKTTLYKWLSKYNQ